MLYLQAYNITKFPFQQLPTQLSGVLQKTNAYFDIGSMGEFDYSEQNQYGSSVLLSSYMIYDHQFTFLHTAAQE